MARTKTIHEVEQHNITDEEAKGLPATIETTNQLAAADAMIMDSFDAIKAIGRIEAAAFYETVSQKLIVETAINIREGKKYKGLPFQRNGKTETVSTFDQFCEVFLGKTARRMSQLIDNYNLLGPELYEQAEQIGFRQRDYAALKALPEDDRLLIAQAIEAESLDNALDLMQQLAAKHQNEKIKFTAEHEEITKTLASKDAVIAKKDEKLNELDQELERIRIERIQMAHTNWPEAFQGYYEQLTITRKNLKHAIGSLEVIRQSAMAIEPMFESEEYSLTIARELLATELVGIHNECAEMLTALGLSFDKTLGAFSEARIQLLNV